MQTVHLIHGFNEEHAVQRPNITVLKPLLRSRGYRVRVHDYGEWDLLATRNNKNLARLIFPHVADGDTLIGFSNGAALVAHLQEMGVCTPNIVLIQPALANTWRPNTMTKKVTVFWNPGDIATVAGKWWRRVTGILPWRWQEKHKWGEMGHTGYVGNDPRYTQYRTDDGSVPKLPEVSGHGRWSAPQNRPWREFIISHV
jgi:hypothetical protein